MNIEVPDAGSWMAGPLNWPAGGYPTSVWFVRRRGATLDQLVAPWFRNVRLDADGLTDAFELARQRLWIGSTPGEYIHLTLVDGRTPGAVQGTPSVVVRGPGTEGVVALPRDVPLGYLTDEEVSELVAVAHEGAS